MKTRRLLGIVFVVAAAAGMLICLYGVFITWRVRANLVRSVEDNLALLGDTLGTTRDGLDVVDQVLETTGSDIALVQSTVLTLTLGFQDTNEILSALADLTGEDLPAVISATQTSLESAQVSARLIDDVLSAISRIPLLGLGVYQPEVSLSTAIGEIGDSLEPLTPSLENVSTGLEGAGANLDNLESQLSSVAETSAAIETAVSDARVVIADYQEILIVLETQVETARLNAPRWTGQLAWGITLILAIILFPQIGLGERGLAILRESPADSGSRPIDPGAGDDSPEPGVNQSEPEASEE